MTSRKKYQHFQHWHVAGEVFAISDCIVLFVFQYSKGSLTVKGACDILRLVLAGNWWVKPVTELDQVRACTTLFG